MQQALSFITLGVGDLDTSREFYSEGLGWKPTLALPEIVFYQVAPGAILSIFPLASLGTDTGETATPGTPFTLSQNVASEAAVDEATERARVAGARVIKEPRRADFGGYHSYVADPDGHRWEICHNPWWSVDADGTVRMGEPN